MNTVLAWLPGTLNFFIVNEEGQRGFWVDGAFKPETFPQQLTSAVSKYFYVIVPEKPTFSTPEEASALSRRLLNWYNQTYNAERTTGGAV